MNNPQRNCLLHTQIDLLFAGIYYSDLLGWIWWIGLDWIGLLDCVGQSSGPVVIVFLLFSAAKRQSRLPPPLGSFSRHPPASPSLRSPTRHLIQQPPSPRSRGQTVGSSLFSATTLLSFSQNPASGDVRIAPFLTGRPHGQSPFLLLPRWRPSAPRSAGLAPQGLHPPVGRGAAGRCGGPPARATGLQATYPELPQVRRQSFLFRFPRKVLLQGRLR